MRSVFTNENLALVRLTAKINLFSIDLVRNVDEEDIKEVITGVIRLEDDLDLIRLVGSNSCLVRDHDIRNLLVVVLYAMHLRLKAEVNRERRDVLNLESLLGDLADNHITEGQNTVFRSDLDLGTHACTLQEDRHHGVIGEHHATLLLDLLEERFKLHDDRLCLAWFDRSHGVENGEAAIGCHSLQAECFFHRSDVLNQNLLSLLEGNRDLAEIEHICVGDESLWHCRGPDLQEQCLDCIAGTGVRAAEVDGKQP